MSECNTREVNTGYIRQIDEYNGCKTIVIGNVMYLIACNPSGGVAIRELGVISQYLSHRLDDYTNKRKYAEIHATPFMEEYHETHPLEPIQHNPKATLNEEIEAMVNAAVGTK